MNSYFDRNCKKPVFLVFFINNIFNKYLYIPKTFLGGECKQKKRFKKNMQTK